MLKNISRNDIKASCSVIGSVLHLRLNRGKKSCELFLDSVCVALGECMTSRFDQCVDSGRCSHLQPDKNKLKSPV